MKVSIRNNIILFINTILFFVVFILFYYYLHIINYDFWDDGIYSYLGTLRYSFDIHYHIEYMNLIEKLRYIILVMLLPMCSIFISMVYVVIRFILIINKNIKIKFVSLIVLESLFLFAVTYIYMFDLFMASSKVINKYLSSIYLTPIILFCIYDIITTIICYKIRKTSYIKLKND